MTTDDEGLRMNKVVRNGLVAVIVSPGYGAGWSTWSDNASPFDPTIVRWIEEGKSDPTPYKQNEDDSNPYNGGLYQAEITWVPEGTQFTIDEYDGFESIKFRDDDDLWKTA